MMTIDKWALQVALMCDDHRQNHKESETTVERLLGYPRLLRNEWQTRNALVDGDRHSCRARDVVSRGYYAH